MSPIGVASNNRGRSAAPQLIKPDSMVLALQLDVFDEDQAPVL